MDADATPKPVITDGPNIRYAPKELRGALPESLVLGPNGLVYGATFVGGSSFYGSLFSFDPVSGVIRTLHDFAPPEGVLPQGPLLYSDGTLYGTTLYGGINDYGTIFSYDADGKFQTLYKFDGQPNGRYTLGGLAFGTDGDLYTTANSGGKYGFGTVLDFTGGDGSPNHHFSFNPVGDPGDGSGPEGGLTWAMTASSTALPAAEANTAMARSTPSTKPPSTTSSSTLSANPSPSKRPISRCECSLISPPCLRRGLRGGSSRTKCRLKSSLLQSLLRQRRNPEPTPD